MLRFILSTFLLLGQVPLLPAQTLSCTTAHSDPDGDGWGWENNQSCRVSTAVSNNDCIDTDGDSWGWSDAGSCRVGSPNEPTPTQASTRQTDCIDSDGDGWGWRNGQSCRVEADNTAPSGQPTDLSDRLPTAEPYPQRDPFLIKSIQTDHWPERSTFIQANTAGVAINLVWADWQPLKSVSPCQANQVTYNNHCYSVPAVFDEEIRHWSAQGLNVTGILWGVPAWARTENCHTDNSARDLFCTANNPSDFARFAGMLAKRYNNRNSHGKLDDFVIHNEVNMNDWYDDECGQGIACQPQRWIDRYSADFNAAYDAIKREQANAKVFIPLAHQFAESFDQPAQTRPILSVQSFIRGFNANAQGRQWQLAYHPYNKSLGTTDFSIDDLPHVTFGNIGILASWLRNEFSNQPYSWEIYLTESGFNSVAPVASETQQAQALCDSLHNALATPGIENYIYHRMQDHPAELAARVGLGLRDTNGRAKASWQVWSHASGRHGNRNSLDCGFEYLPYTRVSQYQHANRPGRTSSRIVKSGYVETRSWYLHRNHIANASMLHECQQGDGSYLSSDSRCSGNLPLGPVGYATLQPGASTVLLYTCEGDTGRYTSDRSDCENDAVLEVLGYARTRH